MTALEQFTRLEALGIWREAPDAQRRDVVVSFGDATLVLTDPRSEIPLTHWSLPAVTRLNPGQVPAIYTSGPESRGDDEVLEIDDALMVDAIGRVHNAIATRKPRPGHLRHLLMMTVLAGAVLAGWLWLPAALTRHTANIVPPSARHAISQAILADFATQSHRCHKPAPDRALNELAHYVVSPRARVAVFDSDLTHAIILPDETVVIGRNMLSDAAGAQVLAGRLISAKLASTPISATKAALDYAGPRAALNILFSGLPDPKNFAGYAKDLIAHVPPAPSTDAMLARFEALAIPSSAFAYAIDPTGESVLALIEADPMAHQPKADLFTSRVWTAVANICAPKPSL